MNKLYENVNPNKLVDELQANGLLERESMAFFPKDTGLEIRFSDINQISTPIYEQVLTQEDVEITPQILDEDGNVLVEAVTELQDVYVNGDLLEEVITYTKRTSQEVEVSYVEMVDTEVPILDDNGQPTFDKEMNAITEIIQVETPKTRIEVREVFIDYDPTELLADIQAVVDAHDQIGLLDVRASKIAELSAVCGAVIEDGVLFTKDGVEKRYSAKFEDQLSMIGLSKLAENGIPVSWHSNGESCQIFTAEEFTALSTEILSLVIKNQTYMGEVKDYINSLDDPDTINNFVYGQDLPDEYMARILEKTSISL